MTRRNGLTVTLVLAAVFAAFGAALWLTATHASAREVLEPVLDVIFILPFVVVGAILLRKGSAGVIGWLLVGCGAGIMLAAAVNTYANISLGAASGQLPADLRLALMFDRRFNRAYDDRQVIVESFAHRLRNEVGLEAVASEVTDTAVRAVQPTQGSLWLALKGPR